MALENVKLIPLEKAFTGWFVFNPWDNQQSYNQAVLFQNWRVKEKSNIIRRWYSLFNSLPVWEVIKWFLIYKDRFICITDDRSIYISNVWWTTFTNIWDVNFSDNIYFTPSLVWFSNYVMIYNTGIPQYINLTDDSLHNFATNSSIISLPWTFLYDWTALKQTDWIYVTTYHPNYIITTKSGTETSREVAVWTYDSWSGTMTYKNWLVVTLTWTKYYIYTPVDFYPWFAELSTDRQFLAGNKYNKDWIYISKPATDITNAWIMDFKSAINPYVSFGQICIWLKQHKNWLVVFLENGIKYFTWLSEQEVVQFSPIDNNVQLQTYRTIAMSDNSMFFMTKDKKIKSLFYETGITNPVMADLSSKEGNSIDFWLDTYIHDDYSSNYAYFSETENIVFFNFRSVTNEYNYPDMCVWYDIIHKVWLEDTNKPFINTAYYNWKIYAIPYNSNKICIIDNWSTDLWTWITFKRKLKKFDFWNGTIRKLLRELVIWWKMNIATTLILRLYWDWELLNTIYLDKSLISNPTSWIIENTDSIYDFRKLFSQWELYEKFYMLELEIESVPNADAIFSLNYMSVKVWAIAWWATNELFEK